jgi:hypothetical protein
MLKTNNFRGKRNHASLFFCNPNLKTMQKEKLKQVMLSAISSEVEQWAEESQQIKDGYNFEDRLLLRMRNIGKIMMEQSVGKVPKSPNQKKTSIQV